VADVTTPIPVAFNWSGGKDSAHALGILLRDDRYELRCLLTTVYGDDAVSSVHEVPVELLRQQAAAIGVRLHTVKLATDDLTDYAEAIAAAAKDLRAEGVRAVAFGDLEHSGALKYREDLFGPLGLTVVEPLWAMTSRECIEAFLQTQIDARVIVVNADVLGPEHLGATLDEAFVHSLPKDCDPCGEFGEFHTFVVNAPYFRHKVEFTAERSEPVKRQIGTSAGVKTFSSWQLRIR